MDVRVVIWLDSAVSAVARVEASVTMAALTAVLFVLTVAVRVPIVVDSAESAVALAVASEVIAAAFPAMRVSSVATQTVPFHRLALLPSSESNHRSPTAVATGGVDW